jgi:YVTN family beta-propeller protein
MKTHFGGLVAISAILALGCGSRRDSSSPPSAPGTGVSKNGLFAYSLDAEADLLTVTNRKTKAKIAEIRVGKAPEQLAVANDEAIYVANRGSRTVSVISPRHWTEKAKILVGLEPLALEVSRDGNTLYVVNGSSLERAESGSLMAIALSTNTVRWELPIEGEPRALSLVDEGTAKIDLYKRSEPVWVNLTIPALTSRAPAPSTQAREAKRLPRPFPTLHAAAP